MKKTILILSGIIITIFSIAQSVWKVPVYNTADKTDIMTLRIKPGMIISLVSVLNKNDSKQHRTVSFNIPGSNNVIIEENSL